MDFSNKVSNNFSFYVFLFPFFKQIQISSASILGLFQRLCTCKQKRGCICASENTCGEPGTWMYFKAKVPKRFCVCRTVEGISDAHIRCTELNDDAAECFYIQFLINMHLSSILIAVTTRLSKWKTRPRPYIRSRIVGKESIRETFVKFFRNEMCQTLQLDVSQ